MTTRPSPRRVIPLDSGPLSARAIHVAVSDLARCGEVPVDSYRAARQVQRAAPWPTHVERGWRVWWVRRLEPEEDPPWKLAAFWLVVVPSGVASWAGLLWLLGVWRP